MTVIQIPWPLSDAHRRPARPRPAVWRSERTSVPDGVPTAANPCASSIVDAVESNTTTRGTPRRLASVAASTPSYFASSATGREEHEDHDTQREAIHREHAEAMTRDVAEQHGDRQPAAKAGRDNSGNEWCGDPLGAQEVRDLEERGGRRDRHAHEEAEHRGALPVEAERTSRRHRRSRPRDARHERQHLG